VPLLTGIQTALQNALGEMRGIAAGLALPQLAGLSPAELFEHAARAHEKRTHTPVDIQLSHLPAQLSLPTKITVYRLVQEALTNSFKHAGGVAERICAEGMDGGLLSIEVSDRGPGFDPSKAVDTGDHLGLVGMRERVESLGGTFEIKSSREGTVVRVLLHVPEPGGSDE
jgi:signal transduction histidine kinase